MHRELCNKSMSSKWEDHWFRIYRLPYNYDKMHCTLCNISAGAPAAPLLTRLLQLECSGILMYSHGHFWFVKNQFFWNFCFSVKDAEKFIKHHLFIYKRFTTDQNFKGVTQKLRLPRPWQVQNWPNYTMPFYYVKVPK